jgi:hypothetical protein
LAPLLRPEPDAGLFVERRDMERPVPATLLAVALAGAAAAFPPTAAAGTDPAVTLPLPRLTYHSAFATMTGHADAAPVDWARSNALVGELKGHAGHLRGSATSTPADTGARPAAGQGGHGAHGTPGAPERRP